MLGTAAPAAVMNAAADLMLMQYGVALCASCTAQHMQAVLISQRI
jgi:hypothetical protein